MARVLIVEDEWLQAENIEALLALRGHSVCGSATTGEEAIVLAKAQRPDIVMMDIQLPGRLDGIIAAAEIQAACSYSLVFVTAYDDTRMVERMRCLKPAAVFHKPVNEAMLLDAVDRIACKV